MKVPDTQRAPPILAAPAKPPANPGPVQMSVLTAPTRARSVELDRQRFDKNYISPELLSDGLYMDTADAVRKGKPNISDDELEAVFTGLQAIGKAAQSRQAAAKKVELMAGAAAVLATRLERVDATLLDLAAAGADTPAVITELAQVMDSVAPELRKHGLAETWRADVLQDATPLREVVAKAITATGHDFGKVQQLRQERAVHERLQIATAAAQLWQDTFDASDPGADADGFVALAERAAAEVSGEELDGD